MSASHIRPDRIQPGDRFIPTDIAPDQAVSDAIARGAGHIASKSLIQCAIAHRKQVDTAIIIALVGPVTVSPIAAVLQTSYTLMQRCPDTDLLPASPDYFGLALGLLNASDPAALGLFTVSEQQSLATLKTCLRLLSPVYIIWHHSIGYAAKRACLTVPKLVATQVAMPRTVIMATQDPDYNRLCDLARDYAYTVLPYERVSDKADNLTVAYKLGEHLGISATTIAMGLANA